MSRTTVTRKTSPTDSPRTTTYIRQAQPVTLEIAGRERTVGEVGPISFDSQTGVVIPVPGGTVYSKPMYGVGDDIWPNPGSKPFRNLCSATWDHVGPGFQPSRVQSDGCDNIPDSGLPSSANPQQYIHPSHRQPGVITEVETTDELPFIRVCDSDGDCGPKGSWLAQLEAVKGEDTSNIVDNFALFDPMVMVDDPANDPWGEYDCLAKVYVPDDYPLHASYAGGFYATAHSDDLSGQKLETGSSTRQASYLRYRP